MTIPTVLATRSDRAGHLASPERDQRARLPSRWLVAGLAAVLLVPLAVGLIGFRDPPWVPVLDLAMTELRVRDAGTSETPLIGLPGRIGTLDEQGSHPGPVSFYLLAPTYRLLGSSAWALQIATVVVHAAAVATALALARRRGGPRLLLAVAVGLALLMGGYGISVLSEPWNPYLPLLWWPAGLLAVWSVLAGDVKVLPVAVFALSFGAQTHVPYLGLGLGMGALTVAGMVVLARQHPGARRHVLRWALIALGVGVVLWMPPTIDQLTNDPGNYRKLTDHFLSPPEDPVGLGAGLRETLERLDPVYHAQTYLQASGGTVVESPDRAPGATRGGLFVALWAGAALASLRPPRCRALLAMHATVAAGVLLSAVTLSRVFGRLWYYLSLWVWGVHLLAGVAIAWTAVALLRDRLPADRANGLLRGGTAVAAAFGLVVVARTTVAAPDADHADTSVVEMAAAVVADTAEALDGGTGAADGPEAHYLVTWSDALHIGSPGYALLSELERRGFDVAADPVWHAPVTDHRVSDGGDATARVHLATGSYVEQLRAEPQAIEVATDDPRTPADRTDQARLIERLEAELEALGRDDLLRALHDNLFLLAVDDSLPDNTRRLVERIAEVGGLAAVFILPVEVPVP